MDDHYYSKKPSASNDRQVISETIKGVTLKFITDAGVFSKRGIDFGSKLLIESMELSKHSKVLDVGCGYGPIGLFAASYMQGSSVTLIDINERAIELARQNAAINQLKHVTVLQSNLFEQLGSECYTTILTNPPIRAGKQVVHSIYEQAYEYLEPGGELWIVIQKKQGAPSTLKKLEQLYERVIEVTKDKGYRIFKATK